MGRCRQLCSNSAEAAMGPQAEIRTCAPRLPVAQNPECTATPAAVEAVPYTAPVVESDAKKTI